MDVVLQNKEDVYRRLLEKYVDRRDAIREEAEDTAQRARDSEGPMITRYDTHKYEGSWLANGLSERVRDLERTIDHLQGIDPSQDRDRVTVGSLVAYEMDNERNYMFVTNSQNFEEIEYKGHDVRALSKNAPIVQPFLGKKAGDTASFRNQEYRIEGVR